MERAAHKTHPIGRMKSRKDSLRKRRLWGEMSFNLFEASASCRMRERSDAIYFIENDTDAHAEELEEKCLQFFIRISLSLSS